MPTILIIEDEIDLVRVLRSYLEQANYWVFSAVAVDLRAGLAWD